MTIRSIIVGVGLLLIAWVGLLAGVMVATDAAPAALVPMPSGSFLTALPESVAIVSRTAVSVTLVSDTPRLTSLLYASGAWLVLPAGLAGCAPS